MGFEQAGGSLIYSSLLTECQVSVVIPVRNEAANLDSTLAGFANQKDLRGQRLDPRIFEIIILANNCTDESAEIVKKFQRENSRLQIHLAEVSLAPENANIGFVRRLLMNEAFFRFKDGAKDGVLMTTDGDTIVADDWIAANLAEIECGADAVGGRIIIADEELAAMDDLCRETHLLDEEYRLLLAEIESLIYDLPFDHAPRHHQHFNGSFAVTTAIYEKAGGIPDVKFLEDCAFFDSLQRIDANVRHSPQVKVYTSSRRDGRSEVGLSFQLNLWKNLNETGEKFLVESAESIVERFTIRRDLRKIRRENSTGKITILKSIEQISERILVDSGFILRELAKKQTFGVFYENLLIEQNRIGEWARKFPFIPLDDALKNLKIAAVKLQPMKSANSSGHLKTTSAAFA